MSDKPYPCPRTDRTRMRGIIAYLLCIALLAQSVAFGVAGHADCGDSHDCAGMQAGMPHVGEPGSVDCCNDPETFDETGQPCKSGQACGHGLAFVPTCAPAVRVSGQAPPIAPSGVASPPIGRSADVWRPPSLC